MRTFLLIAVSTITMLAASPIKAQQTLDALIGREINSLVETYKMLHAAPELSHREEKTASFFASQLRALGFTVTERVGKFDRPEWLGYGVVAVMKNGDGPTVLLRTDLDGLPVSKKQNFRMPAKLKLRMMLVRKSE